MPQAEKQGIDLAQKIEAILAAVPKHYTEKDGSEAHLLFRGCEKNRDGSHFLK